jgi:hypothetical protein
MLVYRILCTLDDGESYYAGGTADNPDDPIWSPMARFGEAWDVESEASVKLEALRAHSWDVKLVPGEGRPYHWAPGNAITDSGGPEES